MKKTIAIAIRQSAVCALLEVNKRGAISSASAKPIQTPAPLSGVGLVGTWQPLADRLRLQRLRWRVRRRAPYAGKCLAELETS